MVYGARLESVCALKGTVGSNPTLTATPSFPIPRAWARGHERMAAAPTATSELRTVVAESKDYGIPVLVDFWAPWCGPCRALAPLLDTLAREQGKNLLILKVDVDAHPDAAKAYSVTALPTLVLFRDGEEAKRHVGAANLKALQAFITAPPAPASTS